MEEHIILKNHSKIEDVYSSVVMGHLKCQHIRSYLMKNFSRDISDYQSQEDFLKEEWIGMNEDRGIIRRQRVYLSLLMSPGIYLNDDTEEDFAYIRHYRGMI